MRNRNKYDWTKPFKIVENKKIFDELETNEQSLVISLAAEQPKPVIVHKKEQIIVPKIETVKRVSEVKSFAKINPNYIRLPSHLNLPRANQYQLTQVDHVFMQGHQNKFKINGKTVLTAQFLSKAFIELETRAGKDPVLPRNKGWMMAFLEKQYKEYLKMDNVEVFAETVYNFWKNRRQELRFPLLRTLWRPNPQEYNYMLAFKIRQKEKRNLRRTNRFVEDQILEELFDQFDLMLKVTDRVQAREELKFRATQLQINSFYNDCKSFLSTPSDITNQITPDIRQKDREKLKKLHGDLENYKSKKQSQENFVVQYVAQNSLDQKLSIVNFLSTIVAESELLGISYDKIFNPGQRIKEPLPSLPGITKTASVINQGTELIEVSSPVFLNDNKAVEACLNISLRRVEDLVVRTFDEEYFTGTHKKPCLTYFDFKKRQVDSFYFGSDDEGEYKDLKKNISTSFKKFQQMHQANKTIMTSQ